MRIGVSNGEFLYSMSINCDLKCVLHMLSRNGAGQDVALTDHARSEIFFFAHTKDDIVACYVFPFLPSHKLCVSESHLRIVIIYTRMHLQTTYVQQTVPLLLELYR